MAVFHRYAGPCRNPKCNRTVRSNGFTVYCWSCTALDIRYGDPRQRRITQKALTKPLAAVARIRKRNPNADWHLMAENWNILVRRCQEISASKDADSLYRRKAAHVIVQIAESLSPDEVVNVIAACYIIEDQNPVAPERALGRPGARDDKLSLRMAPTICALSGRSRDRHQGEWSRSLHMRRLTPQPHPAAPPWVAPHP